MPLSRRRRRPRRKTAANSPVIGLTGGIGAGKSTALAALERLGAAVLSTDEVVHDLYESDAVRDAVVERFGAEVTPGGVIDRAALAERAFATTADREWLEGLLWPLVGEHVTAWRVQMQLADPPPRALVVEVPLLFEAGMGDQFDATLAIVADETLRDSRARARGHQALDARAKRQLDQSEKAQRATFVVANDGSVADLERELSSVLDILAT